MKFFAVYEGGELKEVGKLYGDFVTDFAITEAEYTTLLAEIRAKAQLVDDVYNGVKSLDDVPAEWRDEIQRRVTERQEAEAEAEPEQSEMDDMAAALTLLGVTPERDDMGKWLNGAQAKKREIDGKDTRITALAAAGAVTAMEHQPPGKRQIFMKNLTLAYPNPTFQRM